ncbi:MAG: pseudouridine synthase [Spirochaetes bacterium]|nr:pseudouridine synthase [Spirochaetota bacterium]
MKLTIPVLYSDDLILAVDKPAGLLSAPDRYDPAAPTAKAQLEPEHGRLWPVHQLDRDTSGVLLFARTADAHRKLSVAFERREVTRIYRAIVRGRPEWMEVACELPLLVDGDKVHRTIIDAGHGKSARTVFALLESWRGYALVEARPETDRTHQVRVHFTALGFPIACDPLYGTVEPIFLSKVKRGWKGDAWVERPLMSRTALHAFAVELPRLSEGETEILRIEAPYPKDLRAVLTQFAKL